MVAIDSAAVAQWKPLDEVARDFGVSPATMWRWVREFEITKATMPGYGKATFLDPAEVRRKLRPRKKKGPGQAIT